MKVFKIIGLALALSLAGLAGAQYYPGGTLKIHGHSTNADGGTLKNLKVSTRISGPYANSYGTQFAQQGPPYYSNSTSTILYIGTTTIPNLSNNTSYYNLGCGTQRDLNQICIDPGQGQEFAIINPAKTPNAGRSFYLSDDGSMFLTGPVFLVDRTSGAATVISTTAISDSSKIGRYNDTITGGITTSSSMTAANFYGVFNGTATYALASAEVLATSATYATTAASATYAATAASATYASIAGTYVLPSTMAIPGSGFSIGGGTFVVKEGQVGIGTLSPSATLDVRGDIWAGTNSGFYNQSGYLIIQPSANLIMRSASAGASISACDNNACNVHFAAGGGKVGVGTDTPGDKLEVNGGITAATMTLTGSSFSVGGSTLVVTNGKVSIGTVTANTPLTVAGPGFDHSGALNIFSASSGGDGETIKWTTAYDNRVMGDIYFDASGASGSSFHIRSLVGGVTADRFSVDASGLINFPSGNVGIGTVEPADKLDISSGTIRLAGSGAPTPGFALCLNAAGQLSTCGTSVGVLGACVCN